MKNILDVTSHIKAGIYKLPVYPGYLKWHKDKNNAWHSCRESFHKVKKGKILLLTISKKQSFKERMEDILNHFDLEILETNEDTVIAIKLNPFLRRNYMFGMLTALIKNAAKYEKFPEDFNITTMTGTEPAFDIICKIYKTNKSILKQRIQDFTPNINWFKHFSNKTEKECLKKLIKKEFLMMELKNA
jgi:hypothetical protein